MKASILAIGTELTSGQILNKNATNLSKKLKNWGILTSIQLTVPDDHGMILRALEFCSKDSHLIFITGGLGPTSDDFTRNVVSEWMNRKLYFNEDSWQHIQSKLAEKGLIAKEIQRQQCFFPENSKILFNNEGTAHGFYCEYQNKNYFILPGPPREIEACWISSIEPWLKENTKDLDAAITHSWDTIGYPESEVALRVNAALDPLPHTSNLEIGYRVHLPYVEVKVSYFQSSAPQFLEHVKALDSILSDISPLKNGEDLVDKIKKALSIFNEVFVEDEYTEGFLLRRLMDIVRSPQGWTWILKSSNKFSRGNNNKSGSGSKQYHNHNLNYDYLINNTLPSGVLFIKIISDKNPHELILEMKTSQWEEKVHLESPQRIKISKDRCQQYLVEMTLLTLLNKLENTHKI